MNIGPEVDQRSNYRERGESRARAQNDILVKSLEKVSENKQGEHGKFS